MISPDGGGEPDMVGDPGSLRRELEESLRRLGVEAIDLPAEDGTPLAAYWQAFPDFKAEGKVRHIGLSIHSVAEPAAAEKLGPVETLQLPFSAIRRRPAPLGGRPRPRGDRPQPAGGRPAHRSLHRRACRRPARDDWRSAHPDFTGPGLAAHLALADTLAAVGERHGDIAGAVERTGAGGGPAHPRRG